ncbi:asparagine synthase (glutamine-hydrolyzing) [Candidatus Pelagibacter sp.]|nr:asparagine synthase (glutamine-hydrolyzing) [Candidatus Pelagibacter sp.]
MCGFFVVKSKSKNFKIDKNKFIFCTKMMKHRGPDELKFHFEDNVYFGFNRLSIIDGSKNGSQPFLSEKKDKILVFNGEIYNAQKLKNNELTDKNFKGYSDTEVLMKLYEKNNENILNQINGMFAFLIFDKNKDSLLVARDQFGIKPLYYYEDKDIFIFSSEIKPIIKYTKKKTLSDESIINFFLIGKQDHADKTFFKDIKSLTPGNYLKIRNNRIIKKNYWNIFESKKDNFKSPEYFFKSYKNKMDKIMNEYLFSDKKIATFLSGGVDSSIMSTLVQSKINYKLDTFTYGFKNYKGEELISSKFSKAIQANNYLCKIGPKDVIENLDTVIEKVESPITSIRLVAVDTLYKKASSLGYNVVIEGSGGDELLGGYKYNHLFYQMDTLKKNEFIEYIILDALNKSGNFEKNIFDKIITLSNQSGSTTDGTPFVYSDLFNKEYLNENLDEKFYTVLRPDYYKKLNNLQKSQYQDIYEIKLPKNLNYADKISMSHSIETRLPYLDQELAKLCFNLKNSLKFQNNNSRWIATKHIKTIYKNYNVGNKVSIVDPQRNWLKNNLFEYINDNFLSADFKNLPYFDSKKILNYLNVYKKDKYNSTSYNIFQILSFYKFFKIVNKY